MALSDLNIRALGTNDLPLIATLQPDGWPPILSHYKFYIQSEFCNPVMCLTDNHIAGVGSVIFHKETAWLAHIIVDKGFRNQGIGTIITQSLMDIAKQSNCKSILLVSTTLGEPIYKKLGFQKETEYIFYSGGKTSYDNAHNIQPFHQDFTQGILKLDQHLTGEGREKLLLPHLKHTYLITNDSGLAGFYMPTLGEGLIAAYTAAAGLSLMELKHREGAPGMIPIENQPANQFLIDNGYREFRRGIRMWLGEYIQWRPEMLFGRIGGNLG